MAYPDIIQRLGFSFSFGDVPAILIHNHYSRLFSHRPDPTGAQPFLSHNHSHVEFQYIFEGSGTLNTAKGTYHLTPGQLILLPPRLEHQLQLSSPHLVRQTLSILFLTGSAPQIDPALTPLFSACYSDTPVVITTEPDAPLDRIFKHLSNLSTRDAYDIRDQEALRAFCTLFLVFFSQALPQTDAAPVSAPAAPATQEQELIDSFFVSEFSIKSGAAALAQQLHISTRQLNRILQDMYGMSFRQKMNARRLSVALDRLQNSDDTLQQLAEFLGFSSTTALGIFIKKETGLTPSRIRRGESALLHT